MTKRNLIGLVVAIAGAGMIIYGLSKGVGLAGGLVAGGLVAEAVAYKIFDIKLLG